MKSLLVGAGIILLLCSTSYAQAPQRGKAVDECKSELGPKSRPQERTACIVRKMDVARAAGKVKPKTGEICKYSATGNRC